VPMDPVTTLDVNIIIIQNKINSFKQTKADLAVAHGGGGKHFSHGETLLVPVWPSPANFIQFSWVSRELC
jgi:hypothetical protein